jgi:hypothetical protein
MQTLPSIKLVFQTLSGSVAGAKVGRPLAM